MADSYHASVNAVIFHKSYIVNMLNISYASINLGHSLLRESELRNRILDSIEVIRAKNFFVIESPARGGILPRVRVHLCRAAGSTAGRKKAFARQTSLAALIVDLWFLSLSLSLSLDLSLARRRASSASRKNRCLPEPTIASPKAHATDTVIASLAVRGTRTTLVAAASFRGTASRRAAVEEAAQRDKKPASRDAHPAGRIADVCGIASKSTTAKDAGMKARNGHARTVRRDATRRAAGTCRTRGVSSLTANWLETGTGCWALISVRGARVFLPGILREYFSLLQPFFSLGKLDNKPLIIVRFPDYQDYVEIIIKLSKSH